MVQTPLKAWWWWWENNRIVVAVEVVEKNRIVAAVVVVEINRIMAAVVENNRIVVEQEINLKWFCMLSSQAELTIVMDFFMDFQIVK